jgi:allophanate hydrolase subunit 2
MLPLAGSEFPRKGGVISQAYGDDALRVLPGPQLSGFVDGALKGLTKDKFSVSSDASRLGVRLSGPALKYADGELASQAVLPGAIQVPPDGRPIILGWDGPVTGGYPVIAGVIAADLHRLAQLRPGDTLEFRFVSREEAQEAWVEQRNVLNEAIEWDA